MSNITEEDEANTFNIGRKIKSLKELIITSFSCILHSPEHFSLHSLGNTLILTALHKVCAIHPPTKRLFRWLAVTDLCVGLVLQPAFVTTLLAGFTDMNRNLFYYSDQVSASGYVLFAVSIVTSTAINVDRRLAHFRGLRHVHVVTFRWFRAVVHVICFW